MDISFFTRRYVDRSKNTGFQFEFFCDRCNKGHMTPFRIHALGVVTSIWDATDWKKEKEKDFDFDTLKKDVSRLFLKGKAWIEAYTNAVEEAQKYFKHCARCLKWVCPKSCFNPRANLCQGCAPLTEAELAALKAEERRKEAAKPVVDAVDAPRTCPHCGKSNPVATFCADCGKKVVQDIFCPSCGAKWSTEKKMRFCPRCGEEMPELAHRHAKPHVVKSEAEKHVDKAVDTFVDLSTEVKKVAEEYKKVAEDILGLNPKKREAAKPASTSSTPEHQRTTVQKPAHTAVNPSSVNADKSAGEGSSDKENLAKPKTGAKAKGRRVTKISKAKRPTGQKKKSPAAKETAPTAKKKAPVAKPSKKRVAKSNEPKGQPKSKAKKKPKPKS